MQIKVALIIVGVMLIGVIALVVWTFDLQPTMETPILIEAKVVKPRSSAEIREYRKRTQDARRKIGWLKNYGYYHPSCYPIKPKDRTVEDLWVGMSQANVRGRWGEPCDIDIDIDEHSRDENWEYSGGFGVIFSLYFEDGELVRIWKY